MYYKLQKDRSFVLFSVFDAQSWLFVTPWSPLARQAPWSMGFPRQEYWSGLLFPSPGDLPNPGIKAGSPALQADALLSEPPSTVLKCAKAEHSWGGSQ